MINVLYVENNALNFTLYKEAICRALGQDEVRMAWVKTESGFWDWVKKDEEVDFIILDWMLPWAEGGQPEPPIPPEVKELGMYKAGLRCCQLLQRNDRLRTVSVAIFTALLAVDVRPELNSLLNPPPVVEKPDTGELVKLILRRRRG